MANATAMASIMDKKLRHKQLVRHCTMATLHSNMIVGEWQHFSQLQAATLSTSDISMVLQSYHQTLRAASLVSATTRVVRCSSSCKSWFYSVFPWAMSSAVLPRCHSLTEKPGMPRSSGAPISDALNTIQYNTIQYNTIQYNTIQYNTIQYNTIQYNTIQ